MDNEFIGIDFGACNIKATRIIGRKIRNIKLNSSKDGGDNSNYVRNQLFYDKRTDGTIAPKLGVKVVGDELLNVVSNIKQKLAMEKWEQYVPNLGRNVTTDVVISDVFKIVKDKILATKSDYENSQLDAVLTVPVVFSEIQKRKIIEAAKLAGINATQIITESFAAFFSKEEYLNGDKTELEIDENQLVLIFDCGGSTLDISLIEIYQEDEEIKVFELASKGMFFGGLDLDKWIFGYLSKEKYPEKIKNILKNDKLGCEKQHLLQEISNSKEYLYIEGEDSVEISGIDIDGNGYDLELSRDDINYILDKKAIKNRINALIEELFEEADSVALQYQLPIEALKENVTRVHNFGGTSYISYFLDMLEENFECFDAEEASDWDDDNAFSIAAGATIYSKLLHCGSSIDIKNIVPFNVGFVDSKGRFRNGLRKSDIYGTGKYYPVEYNYIQENNFKINLYQTFSEKQGCLVNDEEIIFMGTVLLDKEKYDYRKELSIKLDRMSDGSICIITAQLDDENDIYKVETLPLRIGE